MKKPVVLMRCVSIAIRVHSIVQRALFFKVEERSRLICMSSRNVGVRATISEPNLRS